MQPENAASLILVRDPGSVTEVIPLHSENASAPILVTHSGSVREVSPLQSLNEVNPMSVRVSGSVREVSLLQPSNALDVIFVTPEGTTIAWTSSLSPRTPVTVVPPIFRLEQKRLDLLDSIDRW